MLRPPTVAVTRIGAVLDLLGGGPVRRLLSDQSSKAFRRQRRAIASESRCRGAIERRFARQDNASKTWAAKLLERKSARLVSVALANKTARIAWAVLAHNQSYAAPAM